MYFLPVSLQVPFLLEIPIPACLQETLSLRRLPFLLRPASLNICEEPFRPRSTSTPVPSLTGSSYSMPPLEDSLRACESEPTVAVVTTQPKRQPRLPERLKDYVLSFYHTQESAPEKPCQEVGPEVSPRTTHSFIQFTSLTFEELSE